MNPSAIQAGMVVQLNPETVVNPAFAGCFMVITQPKEFGAQGYIEIPASGQAYYRAGWDEMELIGQAEWTVP